MKRLITFIIITVLPKIILAQTPKELEIQITNGTSKQWTLKETNSFLGDTCTNGIRLAFNFQSKIVEKKGCINGNSHSAFYKWVIIEPKPDELFPRLNFINPQNKLIESYFIQFVTKEGKKYLRLRLSGGNKATETTDYYFQ
jgi:hypothetical protein